MEKKTIKELLEATLQINPTKESVEQFRDILHSAKPSERDDPRTAIMTMAINLIMGGLQEPTEQIIEMNKTLGTKLPYGTVVAAMALSAAGAALYKIVEDQDPNLNNPIFRMFSMNMTGDVATQLIERFGPYIRGEKELTEGLTAIENGFMFVGKKKDIQS